MKNSFNWKQNVGKSSGDEQHDYLYEKEEWNFSFIFTFY